MPNRGLSTGKRGKVDAQIGRRIRALRIDKNVSQEDLGKKLGVTFQQIQKYENGSNRIASERLMEIARELETTPHELLGWNGKGIPVFEFDIETYKLAKLFSPLPDRIKPLARALFMAIIAEFAKDKEPDH